MRKFACAAAVVLAFSGPAWGQYPTLATWDNIPAPMGYPAPGYPNLGDPSLAYPTGFDSVGPRPDMLPPVGMPPGPPMAGMPSAPPPIPNTNPGFAYDPAIPSPYYVCPKVGTEYWVQKEWLFWNLRSMPLPPLIVTGNPNLPGAGIPGSGNVIPLVGPQQNLGMFNGIRLTIGRWIDPDGELGGEVSGFIFARKGTTNFFQGNPSLPLSVPTLSSAGLPLAYDFSFPGRFTGGLALSTATQFLGAEGNLLHRWYDKNGVSLDGLLGYRYLWLNERLDLYGQTQSAGATGTFLGTALPAGSTVFTTDSFRTNTQFHGAQFGGRLQVRRDIFTVTTFGKYGLGINLETLNTDGMTTANGQTTPGGVRVLPSNLSATTHNQFSMMGETGIELGVQLTNHINIRVGYNLLWWSSVLRPGNVVSPVVTRSQVPIDPTYSPTPVANAQPMTAFHSSDFLAHGLTVGAVFGW